MTIRSYSVQDEVDDIIALWNASLPQDMIDQSNFCKRVVFDINFDPDLFLIAEEDGNKIGFAYGVRIRVPDATVEPDRAWVLAMGVHPKCRRKGVGSALLSALEKAIAGRGAKTISLGAYPANYFFPGADEEAYGDSIAFFKKFDYVESDKSVSMDLHLRGYQTPAKYVESKAKLLEKGFTFTPFRLRDSMPTYEFLNEFFPHWLPNVRGNILAGRGENTIIVAWDVSREVVGFVMRATDGAEERFGPFGVKPYLQGEGIGGVLFHEMMESMVAQRIFYTYFMWTGAKNIDIYKQWGMKVYRTYTMMDKVL